MKEPWLSKAESAMTQSTSTFEQAFNERSDLDPYGQNALLLFALQMHYGIEDIHAAAETALTDGPNDKKCDLIYLDEEAGEIVVAQAWTSRNLSAEAAKANKASDLNTAISWLITAPIEEVPERIRPHARDVRSALTLGKVRSLELWFVHNVRESNNVRIELCQVAQAAKAMIRATFPEHDPPECMGVEVGKDRLEAWYQSLTVPILVPDEFTVDVDGAFALHGDEWKAVVTSIPAYWLHDLFLKHGEKLFSANVRHYLGSRKSSSNINHGIKRTADESPGKFWAYNNGITALCHVANASVGQTGQMTLNLTGISIVNGAQTTGAIGQLSEAPPADMQVQARFVVCDTPDTIQNIIRFNNSQNPIKPSDFRSSDRTQTRLVKQFKQIPDCSYSGGRRGGGQDAIKRPGNALPAETVAQALAALLGDAGIAFHQKSEIWESDSLYSRYFGESLSARHVVFAYALYTAILSYKRALQAKDSKHEAHDIEKKCLNFLRTRGAPLLFASAVGGTLETILGRAVAARQGLAFDGNPSPTQAEAHWGPIVESLSSLYSSLQPSLSAGLRRSAELEESLTKFAEQAHALRSPLRAIFEPFSAKVRVI